jgi:predicted RecB family nuclease
MTMAITREVLEGHLKCGFKGHLLLTGQVGRPTEYGLMQSDARAAVRRAAAEHLTASVPPGDILRDCAATAAVLGRGVPLLLDVAVTAVGYSVQFDALRRVEGASGMGDFHYVPVLCHEGERPTREQRVLLELLGSVLGAVQGRPPETGFVFFGRAGGLKKVRLRPDDPQIRRRLDQVRALADGPEAPRLRLNSHCPGCAFRDRCRADATARDDISLLRGMSEKEVTKWAGRGVFTVTQLSYTFRARKRAPAGKAFPHQHALQARAVRDRTIYVLGTPTLPTAPARVFLDLEGDPERGFVYLLGMVVEADGTEERFSFWADTPAQEQSLFDQFLRVLGRHADFRVYTYGSYEAAFLRRMIKAGGRTPFTDLVMARLVNVLSAIHAHVYFPAYSNGLKDIAGLLGFRWSVPGAAGLLSVVWRRRWEQAGGAALREALTTYNLDDCVALRAVVRALDAIAAPPPAGPAATDLSTHAGCDVARIDAMAAPPKMRGWTQAIYAVPEFGFVCDRAYFDYQRERVFVRTNPALRIAKRRERGRQGKKDLRANQHVEIRAPECPVCGGTGLDRRPSGSLARLAFDLRITRGAIRRWVTRYTTAWHHCRGCGNRFLPGEYLRLEEFCHALKSWVMYEYVAHRTSLANIADTVRECFDLPVHVSQVADIKHQLARTYEGTYRRLLEKIAAGPLVHADETEIRVRTVGKGYVWVFTNLEEVVYLYRPSREGDFLHDTLKDFRGVLVSDFYAAYDSLPCRQQKCLIHLLRDFNKDLLASPWDEELKGIASDFGRLLRAIVATVDRHGLKPRHLAKHRRAADQFFRTVGDHAYRSEAADGYRRRLLKYADKLFTFLDAEGVPWNNNNAEHAVKAFAHFRKGADALVTEAGLNQYLVLLSLHQTCRYKGVSFLKFLRSRETDIDAFRARRPRVQRSTAPEVYPAGQLTRRSSRKRLLASPPTGAPDLSPEPNPPCLPSSEGPNRE